ncbi:MAG: prenyltransferase/squalene oxidase repeat-containing protein [Candidatus Brocadiia bacterium]
MLRKTLPVGLLLVAAMLAAPAFGADAAKAGLDPAVRKEALKAIDDGVAWLKSCQKEDGTWSLKQYPAITALAARAILQDPSQPAGRMDPAAEKGLAYVASCARPDGGIFCEVPANKGGTQANYNTAASLIGIYAAHETRYEPLVRAARSYLIRTQHLEKDDFYGGWGYDASRKDPHADMSNTGFTMQALYVTAPPPKPREQEPKAAETPRTETPPPEAVPDDPNWAAATAFLSHCQNLASDAEKQRAVSKRPQDIGGFYYHPNGSMAGGELDEDGRQIWHSYGNATALGLECLLEAHVDRTDPRVAATVNWLRSNYNLEEHPGGMGKSGLYFFYHTLARALSMYGEEPLKRADQPAADWRRGLIEKIVALQRTDPQTGLKYWVNDDARWMENDPVLVTAYSVLALETLVKPPQEP